MTLWMMATSETYRSIASRFGVSEATVHSSVRKVVRSIMAHLIPKLIKWPIGDIAEEVLEGFRVKQGMEGVLGAIDGTHIAIKAPKNHQEAYIIGKGFHSIQLQAICDHQMVFTDCYTGWPGSVHDARVLRNSTIYRDQQEANGLLFPRSSFLVGDAAYPLKTWIMTPYKDNGHLTAEQRQYNFVQSSTRMVIERAFSLLKGRFRRLKYVDMSCTNDIGSFILAACALHNLCLFNEEDVEDMMDDSDGTDDYGHLSHRDTNSTATLSRAAAEKRRRVMTQVCFNSGD